MANWSDPRPGLAPVGTATGARGVAYDAGLRAYMLSVYNYMASAVLLTGIVAMGVLYSGAYTALISRTGLSIVLPYQPSTTGRCETPMPRFSRPPLSSSSVTAVCAMFAGVRV